MMWVLWYTTSSLCFISLPHGKLPFEEIVEGILCLCLLLIYFLSTQRPHFHLFRRPRLSEFVLLVIFLSHLPSPVVRTCSFSWAEREILTLSLLYYSKWPSFLLPVFELGSFNPFFYPPSVFNPFLPIPLPPISQMHSYLHLIPVTPLTILWNPIPRPQVQGLASRPQKRSPEARSQQNCLSPIATTAKTPILTGRLPEPELGKSAHPVTPCSTQPII